MRKIALMSIVMLAAAGVASAASVTGDPAADGWAYQGHSLENGTYVRGSGNIGFDIYTTQFTVGDASAFTMHDHVAGSDYPSYYEALDPTVNLWQDGDAIVAVGGVFRDITAADAGWASFP